MATFGLIHGAWHGGWCWKYLVPELQALGHAALTVDLPIDRRDATTIDYADAAADAFRAADDLVVVAHSMAGIVAPLVADRLPLAGIAYLCAVLRRPGMSLADDRADGVNGDISPPGFVGDYKSIGDGFSVVGSLAGAIDAFYQDCKPEDAAWAFSQLRRQQAFWANPSPQRGWPDLPVASILCSDDRVINPVWSRRVARDWLGVEAIAFPGDHSPFLSRPGELAMLLDRLARTTFAA